MSNLYGYSDYDGPNDVVIVSLENGNNEDLDQTTARKNNDDDHDEDDNGNPLQVGFWMEGDSLAPPCGTTISTIHQILQFLQVSSRDILYDLGCGDGRFCFEAYYHYRCTTIGIEIETDLVSRAQELLVKLINYQETHQPLSKQPCNVNISPHSDNVPLPQIHCMDLREIFQRWIEDFTTPIATDAAASNETKFPLPTIVVLYLLPESLLEIEPYLIQLLTMKPKPQCRIVCNTWGIPHWKPIHVTTLSEQSAPGVSTTIYVYTEDSFEHE